MIIPCSSDNLGSEWNESEFEEEGLKVRVINWGNWAQITWRGEGVDMSDSVMVPSDVLRLIVKGE